MCSTCYQAWYNYRAEVLRILGPQCAQCGFSDVRALQLDHKNGGGTQEKKRLGDTRVLRRATQHPEEYQILCANCNWIKRHEQKEHQIPEAPGGQPA